MNHLPSWVGIAGSLEFRGKYHELDRQYSFIMLKIKNHPGKTIAQFFFYSEILKCRALCFGKGTHIFVPFPPILIPMLRASG